MKQLLTVLLIAAGLLTGGVATAQSFNAKLKFASKDPVDVILGTDPSYKEIIQSGVINVLEYYQHSSSESNDGNVKSMLAKYNEHFIEGATSSTLFITDQDIMVSGKILPAGTYGMFTTVDDEDAILIFRSLKKKVK